MEWKKQFEVPMENVPGKRPDGSPTKEMTLKDAMIIVWWSLVLIAVCLEGVARFDAWLVR